MVTVEQSLRSIAINKTLGCDGLRTQWYMAFFEKIRYSLNAFPICQFANLVCDGQTGLQVNVLGIQVFVCDVLVVNEFIHQNAD